MKKILLVLFSMIITAATATAEPNLLAWYQFEQGAADSAGSNDGTVVGTINYEKGPVLFDQHYAGIGDGSSYYQLPMDAYPKAGEGNGRDKFTYSFWLNFNHDSGRQRVMGNFNEGSTSCIRLTAVGGVELGTFDFWLRTEDNNSVTVSTGNIVELGQWNMITITYDGQVFGMYYNGELVNQVNFTNTNFADWQNPITIFAENSRGTVQGFYTGKLDDLRIYDDVMDAKDIEVMYKYSDLRAAAHDQTPADAEIRVPVDQTLSWTAPLDPNAINNINGSVKAQYVWLSSGSPTDPNMVLV